MTGPLQYYYLEYVLPIVDSRLEADIAMGNFQDLQSLVLVRLTMFNRRSGEVSEVRLTDYLTRPKWQGAVHKEIFSVLPRIEQILVKRYSSFISNHTLFYITVCLYAIEVFISLPLARGLGMSKRKTFT